MVPWSWRQAIAGTALALGVLLGSQLVLAELTDAELLPLQDALGLLLPWGHLLMGGTVVWLVLGRFRSGLASLGFRPIPFLRGVLFYLQALLIGYGLTFACGLIVYSLTGRPTQENFLPRLGSSPLSLATAALSICIIAPMTEEVLFRGFLFTGLQERLGVFGATAASSVLFALIHFNPFGFPVYVALGVLLAWLFHRSRSLWPAIALHATINSVTLLVWYAQVSGRLPQPPS